MKKIMILVMVAAFALPTIAQQEFQSTSTMQGTGSSLSSQVTAVGATSVDEMPNTSTPASAPAQSGPRKINPIAAPGPVGDAVLPLLLMAVAFGGVMYVRKRKARV